MAENIVSNIEKKYDTDGKFNAEFLSDVQKGPIILYGLGRVENRLLFVLYPVLYLIYIYIYI